MRFPAQKNKPRTSALASFAAAGAGWVSNENLAQPDPSTPGAVILENIFPTPTGGQLRRGSLLYATLGNGDLPTRALFSYNNGAQQQFFASNDTTIFDVTSIITPNSYRLLSQSPNHIITDEGDFIGQISTEGMDRVNGTTDGAWIDLQFATTGDTYLILVNGADPMELYDGDDWYPLTGDNLFALKFDAMTAAFQEGQTVTGGTSSATAIIVRLKVTGTAGQLTVKTITGTFVDNETITSATGHATSDGTTDQTFVGITGTKPDGSALQTSDFSYVWQYQDRLFFIEKGSMDAWYLPIDQIGGAATIFPMGGIFSRGGFLVFGQTWSLDSGASGGLSEQCIFMTSEGEIAVYQGTNPSDANSWARVSTLRVGKPQGPKAWIRAGGDIVVATDIGFVPLSVASQRDYSVLPSYAVSSPIVTDWASIVFERGNLMNWHCELWANRQMVVIAMPAVDQQDPFMLVVNATTGAWTKFTNWDGLCLEVFRDRLFYGSKDGKIIEAYVTGSDQGQTYTGKYAPLFTDEGSPGAQKLPGIIRAVTRGPWPIVPQMDMMFNYEISLPAPPSVAALPDNSQWGVGIWGQSIWGAPQAIKIQQQWESTGGEGYAMAPLLQITSGGLVPLDTEFIRIDVTYETTDIVAG